MATDGRIIYQDATRTAVARTARISGGLEIVINGAKTIQVNKGDRPAVVDASSKWMAPIVDALRKAGNDAAEYRVLYGTAMPTAMAEAICAYAVEYYAPADWRPDGYEMIRTLRLTREEERAAIDKAIADGTGRMPARTVTDEQIDSAQAQYPAAALWYDAEVQAQNAHWSDPIGAAAAAKECRRIIRETGNLETARVALAVRREIDALGM